MIDYWFDFIVNKSTGISIILLVILTARPLVLKYLNASTAYSLWLMISAFLILPVDFVAANGGSAVMTIFPGAGILDSSSMIDELLIGNNIKLLITLVWIAGFIATSLFYGLRFKKLSHSLKPFQYQSLVFENLNSKKQIKPNIVTSSLVNEPAIFGLIKQHLILPHRFNEYSLTKQNMILRHEFYHLARHDHQINCLRIFIKCLFWFNPLVFFVDKYCEADQEISCDQGVLKNDDPKQRQAYAQVLVDSVNPTNQISLKQPLNNRLLSQWKYPSLIKERVKMLKQFSSKKWHKWLAVIFSVSTIWMVNGTLMAEKVEGIGNDVMEIATTFVPSRYPRKAAIEGVEGSVKIKFDIDNFGHPFNVEVLKSLPAGVFDKDALTAANKWRFENNKGQKNMIYTMEYKLK